MFRVLTGFFVFTSITSFAADVCLLSVGLRDNPSYSQAGEAYATADCTKTTDTKTFPFRYDGSPRGDSIATNNARKAVIKYLLELGYKPIDSFTFFKN